MTEVISSRDRGEKLWQGIHAKISPMKPRLFDPGLLAVFRLFIGIRLLLALLTVLAQTHLNRLSWRESGFEAWLGLIETSILLVYLSWPWLAQRLGRIYLPAALALATLGPLASNVFVALNSSLPGLMIQEIIIIGQWQVVIVLLIPLILVSWRYGFKAVALYSLFIALFDLAAAALLINSTGILQLWIISIVIVFRTLLYLLIGYSISLLADEQRRQNASLEQANRNLAGYAMTLEQLAISRERNHLARELHDTLAHTLSGLVVQLEAVEALWENSPDEARHMVSDARNNARLGLNEARRAIQSLRAAPLEDLGLVLALGRLARSEAERGGLRLELQAPDNLPNLPPAVEHSLYRVAEEALRNAKRHARASSLIVRLEHQDRRIRLTIEDDGCGFDTAQPPPLESYGLRGMQERAEAIGGQFSVHSRYGEGTRVQLSVEA